MEEKEAAKEVIVVFVMVKAQQAADMARKMVEEHLAACVNIVSGVRSIYLWKDKIWDEPESLLMMKTKPSLFEPLRARVAELHEYEVPEIISLPVQAGHHPYLEWVYQSTRLGQ